jgi:hypothetical protein
LAPWDCSCSLPNSYPGGLNTYSRALAALLFPLDGEPLVAV